MLLDDLYVNGDIAGIKLLNRLCTSGSSGKSVAASWAKFLLHRSETARITGTQSSLDDLPG